MKKYARAIGIIIGSIAIVLSGWEVGRKLEIWGEPDALRVIKAERMAGENLQELEVLARSERGKPGIARKRTSPSVTALFIADQNRDDTYEKLLKRHKLTDGSTTRAHLFVGKRPTFQAKNSSGATFLE